MLSSSVILVETANSGHVYTPQSNRVSLLKRRFSGRRSHDRPRHGRSSIANSGRATKARTSKFMQLQWLKAGNYSSSNKYDLFQPPHASIANRGIQVAT